MRKAINKLMRILSFLVGIFLFAAVILIILQVVSRYILKAPLGWTDQLCRFFYVWIIMLGLPILFHEKSVTVFDVFSSKLKPKQQAVLHIVVCLLTIFFAVCFTYFSWLFMLKKGGMMIPAFKVIPYYAIYASMPVCGVLLCIEMIFQLVESIKEISKRKENKK